LTACGGAGGAGAGSGAAAGGAGSGGGAVVVVVGVVAMWFSFHHVGNGKRQRALHRVFGKFEFFTVSNGTAGAVEVTTDLLEVLDDDLVTR